MGTSRMVKSLSAAAMVVGWSLLTSSTVGAVQSDYLPPNPPAQAVAEGAFGYFSMSGLLIAGPVQITTDCTLESGSVVVSTPDFTGSPDSEIELGIKGSTGPQVMTCDIAFTSQQSSITYTLVLYYGLPLPTTTTTATTEVAPTTSAAVTTTQSAAGGVLPSTGRDVSNSGAAAVALLMLGGGLVVVTRRRARPEF